MNALETANLQKCLEVLTDFHEALPDEQLDEELKKSKDLAATALEQLTRIVNDGDDEPKKKCRPGQLRVFHDPSTEGDCGNS